MSDIYCQFCHHHWKIKKEFDKHLVCCEYFYQLRRNPRPEMDDYGCKMPTQKELFRFVQELSLKCDRLETEVKRMRNTLRTRQKKVISECLNQAEELPDTSFEEWWKQFSLQIPCELPAEAHWSEIRNGFLMRVFTQNLMEAVNLALRSNIDAQTTLGKKMPIRCFTEKPGVFYIYSLGDGKEEGALSWRKMTNRDVETMVDYLCQLFVREFVAWQKQNADCIMENEEREEEQMMYMMRVNRCLSKEKGGTEKVRKWLFQWLEENIHVLGCEYV